MKTLSVSPRFPAWPLAAVAMACWLGAGPAGRAAVVTLQPVADTSLFENDPDNNLGKSWLAAGTLRNGKLSRALLRFDVSAAVPAGATVRSATLTLKVVKAPPAGIASTFGLHRMLVGWAEGAQGSIGVDRGGAAGAGETTWNARLAPGQAWGRAGALAGLDYTATASGTVRIAGPGAYTVATTSGLASDVQAWIDAPASNFGWALVSESESTPKTARRLGNREDPANTPTLAIDFEAPQVQAPSITSQTSDVTVTAGVRVSLEVAASGTAPLQYQWFFNGTALAGATASSHVIAAAHTQHAGAYTVTVSNTAGSRTSAPILVRVMVPPSISVHPTDQTVFLGAPVAFNVVAFGTEPLAYQWLRNGGPILGATNAEYRIASALNDDIGSYSVVVSNAVGTATSGMANLNVLPIGDQLRMFEISRTGNDLSFAFIAKPNTAYLLEAAVSLRPADWGVVSRFPAAGSQDKLILTITIATGNRFYRLRVE